MCDVGDFLEGWESEAWNNGAQSVGIPNGLRTYLRLGATKGIPFRVTV